MNREIKFRAWDDHAKEMISFYELVNNPEMLRDVFTASDTLGVFAMQFTGLHDRNGNEIYEGDILQRDSHWAGEKTGEELACVIFKNAQFMLLWKTDNAETSLFNLLKGFFIIGNIYENPELLQ